MMLSQSNKIVLFKNCNFINNFVDDYLISVFTRSEGICTFDNCLGSENNISFVSCQFNKNFGGLMKITGWYTNKCKTNLFIIGPSQFSKANAQVNSPKHLSLLSMNSIEVYINGPVMISNNLVVNIIEFQYCNVSFNKLITFKSNKCEHVIKIVHNYIKVKEYTNITLINNEYYGTLISANHENEYYPFCIFQFVTMTNITNVSLTHYSISIMNNSYSYGNLWLQLNEQQKKCLFPFYNFNPHCKRIPTTVFHNHNPTEIYQQIIKTQNQNLTYHKICYCYQNGSVNCSVDTLGTVYPGQILQAELCTPCNDKLSTLYAEVNDINLPSSLCKVVPQTDKINTISNYSKKFNFTIVSEVLNSCELFLTASSMLMKHSMLNY